MLDAISDFWKPAKKNQGPSKLQAEQLQIGSSIGFGFVPQTSLSGQRMQVSAVNTYKFGDEALTSFVLAGGSGSNLSMIVADSDGEQYLAISRRLSVSDRIKLFEGKELENATAVEEAKPLTCKAAPPELKGWLVASYKREIQNLKGVFYPGDFRKADGGPTSKGQEFKYTLFVSDSNEHAIEVEQYDDGRLEVYATVYRRMSDIGEISHPLERESRTSLNFSVTPEKSAATEPVATVPVEVEPQPVSAAPAKTVSTPTLAPVKIPETKIIEPQAAKPEAPKPESPKPEAPKPESPNPESVKETTPTATMSVAPSPATQQEEKKIMPMENTSTNGTMSPKLAAVQTSAPENKQEIKAVNKTPSNLESEAIECELRVANKIIDEAIRNEMRLSDVVRRIIELPVAYPEAVQIPITLSNEDFSLLAIRYSLPASDRVAIKRRIVDDLGDFSGKKSA